VRSNEILALVKWKNTNTDRMVQSHKIAGGHSAKLVPAGAKQEDTIARRMLLIKQQ
jgi:hypothetical protein